MKVNIGSKSYIEDGDKLVLGDSRLYFYDSVFREVLNSRYICHPNNITSLRINSSFIENLLPIEKFKKLVSFTLWDIYLNGRNVDISSLSTFKNLESLTIHGYLIEDITPIENLVNLKSLCIYSTGVDLSIISTFKNLTDLNLSHSNIEDIGELSSLVNLVSLNLHNNSISDITPIMSLVNLEELTIDKNNIKILEPICSLPKLNTIQFDPDGIDVRCLLHAYSLTNIFYRTDSYVSCVGYRSAINVNRRQMTLLECSLPRNYRCSFNNLREFGILGL